MKTKLLVLWLALLAGNTPWTCAAERRVALVIGNAAYRDAPLANPVHDASDVASALRSLGFHVIVQTDASQRNMRGAIEEFGAELRHAQVGLFYYAGHGLHLDGTNYFVPVDALIQTEADVASMSVDANYVLRTMEEARVQVSILILDACRTNPFAKNIRAENGARMLSIVRKEQRDDPYSGGLAQMTAATGNLVAFATAPGAIASDGSGRNGTYTKHFLASLGEADSDILKVFQRTRAGVVKETGGKQTPWESTSLIGDFYFRQSANAASIAPNPTSSAAVSNSGLARVRDNFKFPGTSGGSSVLNEQWR
jgi:uncharacterized caspase-like protein